MNRLAQITALSASIDTTLTQFAGLMPNEAGEMPWQAAQRQKRNRRLAAGAAGAAAIGAGVYGANKLKGAMNTRYGTQGMDGIKTGAADLVNRADDAVKAGVGKVRGVAGQARESLGQGMQKAKVGLNRVGAYGKKLGGSLKGGGKFALNAMKRVKFSRADHIIALERKLDGALAEFKQAAN